MRKFEPDSIINGKAVPFSAHGDASDVNFNKGRRVVEVREFIGFVPVKSLDIGPPNAFGKALGIRDNTIGDLNLGVKAPDKDYELILFSEIIEHLMNPLSAMRDCHDLLKPGGRCIVSTPIASRLSFQSPHHFTEYKPDRMRKLFEYAGFKVVKYKKINIWDRRFMFYGVRPFFRVLFHRSQLWMLQK
jgi:SAM-dependent methyltransferase